MRRTHIEDEAADLAVLHWQCDFTAASHTGSCSGVFLWNLIFTSML
jgi:hypothetical protein